MRLCLCILWKGKKNRDGVVIGWGFSWMCVSWGELLALTIFLFYFCPPPFFLFLPQGCCLVYFARACLNCPRIDFTRRAVEPISLFSSFSFFSRRLFSFHLSFLRWMDMDLDLGGARTELCFFFLSPLMLLLYFKAVASVFFIIITFFFSFLGGDGGAGVVSGSYSVRNKKDCS